jgi:3-phenylpropionate/cinnamic acid dioxygenase small subunit
MTSAPATAGPDVSLVKVPAGTPLWGEAYDFLVTEAELLDDDEHTAWLALLADDVRYTMPIRKTLYRKDGRGFDDRNNHFNDDKSALALRVRRNVEIDAAYDRDPAPRIRRLVTNIVMCETPVPDEYAVRSSVLLLRSRFDDITFATLTARRHDVLRRTPEGLRLARRTILVDQSTLGAPYMNVFL